MKLRTAAVQYHLHSIDSFDQFAAQIEHSVKTAKEFESEYVLFPEFVTTQLLSLGSLTTNRQIQKLPDYTEDYLALFRSLSRHYGMYLIGGTHVIREQGKLYNAAFTFTPEGTVHEQRKIHITPSEVKEWQIAGGNDLRIIPTEKANIAVLTCYDIEFPEIVRMARARGADIIFCPSCTDDRHGFHRVRYSCHARAVENQIYVVTTGTVGALHTVDFMRANYGQAAVITPNDIPFPPGGILAEGEFNQEMVIAADLDLQLLYQVRERGSVTTWRDRRTDMYPDWS
ncbi:carbon-nitrogen hydrolase family protein [Marinicrinis sediminis]|uniref:Carbon-nitrogen hydrolase family protein n=1 Tax=Marinicrinis sediminis TaxID=1652465 RepID=A0ABW5RFG7_9BACL